MPSTFTYSSIKALLVDVEHEYISNVFCHNFMSVNCAIYLFKLTTDKNILHNNIQVSSNIKLLMRYAMWKF